MIIYLFSYLSLFQEFKSMFNLNDEFRKKFINYYLKKIAVGSIIFIIILLIEKSSIDFYHVLNLCICLLLYPLSVYFLENMYLQITKKNYKIPRLYFKTHETYVGIIITGIFYFIIFMGYVVILRLSLILGTLGIITIIQQNK